MHNGANLLNLPTGGFAMKTSMRKAMILLAALLVIGLAGALTTSVQAQTEAELQLVSFFHPEPTLAGYPMLGLYVDFSSPVDNQSGATAIPYTCKVNYGDGTVEDGEVMSRDGSLVYTCFGNEQHIYSQPGT
jgi:hypothetical protein